MTDCKEFLKEIISLPGLSGYEEPVRDAIQKKWQTLCDEISTSPVGSLHGLKKGEGKEPRPRLLLAAHMDAIGMMVTVLHHGFIHFTEVGGLDHRLLPGQRVVVHGRENLPGAIIQPPDRLLPIRPGEPVRMEHLVIDVGLEPADVIKLVRPGDLISFAQEPFDLSNDQLAGHTMDDRAAVVLVTECLSELKKRHHAWDVYAVATVQEEETMAGGSTSPFAIRPDIAIAIDVTFAKSPGSSDYRTYHLGKGPTLGWGPNVHPAIYRRMKEMAEKLEIPYQRENMPKHSGTDAFAMQVVAEGIPTMVIGIPLRYMHSPVEMVDYRDIQRGGRLLAEFISHLEPDFIKNITWDEKHE